jgi:hypothetical protein
VRAASARRVSLGEYAPAGCVGYASMQAHGVLATRARVGWASTRALCVLAGRVRKRIGWARAGRIGWTRAACVGWTSTRALGVLLNEYASAERVGWTRARALSVFGWTSTLALCVLAGREHEHCVCWLGEYASVSGWASAGRVLVVCASATPALSVLAVCVGWASTRAC